MKLIGKDPNFTAFFDADLQFYTVFYKGEILVTEKYKYSDIKSYLE
jgi:hypothetical protein